MQLPPGIFVASTATKIAAEDRGRVSHLNDTARRLGDAVGQTVQAFVTALLK